MKPGRQWLVFDAEFFDNSFTNALLERFGGAGVTLFVAYLCACKMSRIPGKFMYRSEFDAIEKLGVENLRLVDNEGLPFTIEEFFEFTGRYKQTSRTRYGQSQHVSATHWEQWQNDQKRLLARDRQRRHRAAEQPLDSSDTPLEPSQHSKKTLSEPERFRRSRANSERDTSVTERDSDSDIYSDKRDTSRKRGAAPPEPPAYKEWLGDPNPEEPVVDLKTALAQLRRAEDVDG